jgi:hypothetical protein
MNEHPKYYITYMKFHADAIHDSATVIHKEKMMNERIRQLYYECQDESQSTEQCYQKFAELIVRECALVANEHVEEAEGVHLGVGRAIKNYFGVDE